MSVSILPERAAVSAQPDPDALRMRFLSRSLVLGFVTIAAISALDTWFAVANSLILKFEQNPICLALMRLEPQGFTVFIAGKMLGTLMVLFCLSAMHCYAYRHVKLVTLSVVMFQVGLLIYLTLSDPLYYGLPNFSLLFQETRVSVSVWILE